MSWGSFLCRRKTKQKRQCTTVLLWTYRSDICNISVMHFLQVNLRQWFTLLTRKFSSWFYWSRLHSQPSHFIEHGRKACVRRVAVPASTVEALETRSEVRMNKVASEAKSVLLLHLLLKATQGTRQRCFGFSWPTTTQGFSRVKHSVLCATRANFRGEVAVKLIANRNNATFRSTQAGKRSLTAKHRVLPVYFRQIQHRYTVAKLEKPVLWYRWDNAQFWMVNAKGPLRKSRR